MPQKTTKALREGPGIGTPSPVAGSSQQQFACRRHGSAPSRGLAGRFAVQNPAKSFSQVGFHPCHMGTRTRVAAAMVALAVLRLAAAIPQLNRQ